MRYAKRLIVGTAFAALAAFAVTGKRSIDFDFFGSLGAFIGFWGIVVFTLLGSVGVLRQADTIRRHEKGVSVSVPWFVVFAGMFLSTALFGFESKRFLLIFHGILRAGFHIPLFVELQKFKGFTKWERRLIGSITLILVADCILPYKGRVKEKPVCFLSGQNRRKNQDSSGFLV